MKKNKLMVYGWNPSILDGTEHIADYTYENQNIPEVFSYKNLIPGVLDQGTTSTCVPHSISSILDWQYSLKIGQPSSFNMSIYNIYDRKENDGEGMTFKNALSILKNIGAVSTKEYKSNDYSKSIKIREYAMVKNLMNLKYSILLNGPCLIATMVKDVYSTEYWKGNSNYGGHAVSCIGWDETGLIIRNSWGKYWGNEGYTHMNYEDFNKYVIECWTVMI